MEVYACIACIQRKIKAGQKQDKNRMNRAGGTSCFYAFAGDAGKASLKTFL